MPAARYWRLAGIETYGYRADLELSEVALYEGATLASGTLTSTIAPILGSLSNLQDSDTGTVCRFSGADVAQPGFALVWDLGVDISVSEIRLSSATEKDNFIHAFLLQRSSNGLTWVDEAQCTGAVYPGVNATYVGAVGYSTGARYVRLFCTSPQAAGAYFRIGEIEFRTDAESANLCVGGTAFASSTYYPASRAFDGSSVVNTNDWVGNPASFQTIGYDFGSVKQVGHVTVVNSVTGVGGELDQGVKEFRVETSVDNVSWSTTTTVSGHPRGSGTSVQYVLFPLAAITPTMLRIIAPSPPKGRLVSAYNSPVGTMVTALSYTPLDFNFGGTYQIAGTVKQRDTPVNTPLRRRVRLLNEIDSRFLRETWSDATTGEYKFTDMRGDLIYTVISYDYTNTYRAVIADNLTAERMP